MGAAKIRTVPLVEKYQIVHHSYVDIMGLLKSLPSWFSQMNYDFTEKGLAEKDLGTGYQVDSEWAASRKVTEYVKYEIDISISAKDLRKIVLESGEETYWARVVIGLEVRFVKDYQNKYKNYGMEEFMRQFYEKYLVKDDLRKLMGKCMGEFGDLTGTIKSYLK